MTNLAKSRDTAITSNSSRTKIALTFRTAFPHRRVPAAPLRQTQQGAQLSSALPCQEGPQLWGHVLEALSVEIHLATLVHERVQNRNVLLCSSVQTGPSSPFCSRSFPTRYGQLSLDTDGWFIKAFIQSAYGKHLSSFMKGGVQSAVSRCIRVRQGRARRSKDLTEMTERDIRVARMAT
jgi:hypothetical protein